MPSSVPSSTHGSGLLVDHTDETDAHRCPRVDSRTVTSGPGQTGEVSEVGCHA
jgi:hypothetical protein